MSACRAVRTIGEQKNNLMQRSRLCIRLDGYDLTGRVEAGGDGEEDRDGT